VNTKPVKQEDNHFLLAISIGGPAMGWFRSPLRITLLVGGSIIVFIVALVAYNRYQFNQKRAELYAVAQFFGYDEANLVSEYQKCFDLDPKCSLTVVYTTTLTKEAFDQRVQAGSRAFSAIDTTAGVTLFIELNAVAKVPFAVNGRTVPDENEYPPHSKWITIVDKGVFLTVAFFDLHSAGNPYTVANSPIQGNLISASIRTR